MTERLWNYLENELDKPTSYLEIETENGTFEVEPNFNWDHSEILGFIVYHNSYMTSSMNEPDIWFWEEIEKHIFS